MWIRFDSTNSYAIKVYIGAVNAVSGEPAVETAATKLRRRNLLSQRKSVQDYIVTPYQLWLDGISTTEGKVRQFVAMTKGSGYSVEVQVTGDEVTSGLQFEITPRNGALMRINIEPISTGGRSKGSFEVIVLSTDTILTVKRRIEYVQKSTTGHQKLYYSGIMLEGMNLPPLFQIYLNILEIEAPCKITASVRPLSHLRGVLTSHSPDTCSF